MSERVDILVARSGVADLRVPPLAVTDGGTDVEWVEFRACVPWLRRRPRVRLPLDPRAAARLRRRRRVTPITLLAMALVVAVQCTGFADAYPLLGLDRMAWVYLRGAALLLWFVWLRFYHRWDPDQRPSVVARHLIRIPAVPRAVADRWVADNPETVRVATGWAPRRWIAFERPT